MKDNLAVRPGSKLVPPLFQFLLDRLVAVEFAVDNNAERLVLVGDGLISGSKVDNTQTCMSERDAAIWSPPVAHTVRTAMPETPGRLFQRFLSDRSTLRKNGNDAAHPKAPSISDWMVR